MSREARCNLLLACARLLYVNGQGTEEVLAAARLVIPKLVLDRLGERDAQGRAISP